MVGLRGELVGTHEHLAILLARSSPDHAYLDVPPVLDPGETGGRLDQIDQADRVTHVEDEDVSVIGEQEGFEDQENGLGGGHEEALHLRVGDRDGASVADLLQEHRNEASPTAEDVSESNRGHPSRGMAR